jgi:hypothetical protein
VQTELSVLPVRQEQQETRAIPVKAAKPVQQGNRVFKGCRVCKVKEERQERQVRKEFKAIPVKWDR